ncbi:hypothetical protein MCM45_21090 [Providencia rettgeri]|uniref:hypothetical protein n=1 Tax=Providencia rettgeri TaxID=587 RepID=UPI001EFE799D|nr:hypothetical protein [Providencia rettgeri]MCG9529028.1 hypothetical protein [Providencia rettgeri]
MKLTLLSMLLLSITGCSTLEKNRPSPFQDVPQQETVSNSESKLLPNDVIPSSTNSCIDDMALLKQTRYNEYQKFLTQYGEIMNEYHFLRKNSEIMDKDTKTYLNDMLTMKRDTLCSKIKFNTFQSIKEKMASLMSI